MSSNWRSPWVEARRRDLERLEGFLDSASTTPDTFRHLAAYLKIARAETPRPFGERIRQLLECVLCEAHEEACRREREAAYRTAGLREGWSLPELSSLVRDELDRIEE